jgi:hypothetical protein
VACYRVTFTFTFTAWRLRALNNGRNEEIPCARLGFESSISGEMRYSGLLCSVSGRPIGPILRVQESWRMGQIDCLETSVGNYHYWLRNKPEQRGSQPLRGGSLTSRVVFLEFKSKLSASELTCSMGISCPFVGKKWWFTSTDHEPATNRLRTDNEPATNRPRTGYKSATNRLRTSHEPTTNLCLCYGRFFNNCINFFIS